MSKHSHANAAQVVVQYFVAQLKIDPLPLYTKTAFTFCTQTRGIATQNESWPKPFLYAHRPMHSTYMYTMCVVCVPR